MGVARIGLYGGSFDPVHLAHLLLAEQCREQLSLDEVWFLPAALPPHKTRQRMTAGPHRIAMLERAIVGHPAFRVNTIEFDRAGPSFTVETLELLTQQHPSHTWWLLLGTDSQLDFPHWKQPADIARLANLVAVNRGEALPNQGLAEVSPYLWTTVTMPGFNISATDIRGRAAEGKSLRYLVPDLVAEYIAVHRLYRPVPAAS